MPTPLSEVAKFIEATQHLRSDLAAVLQTFPQEDCVRMPFHSAHRADVGQSPSEAQQALIPWRHNLADRNQRLRAYFAFQSRVDLLDLLPLIGFGRDFNFGYEITADLCLHLLDQELELLRRERQRVTPPPTEPFMLTDSAPANLTDEQAVLFRQIAGVYRGGHTEPFIFIKGISGRGSLVYSNHPSVPVDADEVDLEHLREEGLIALRRNQQGHLRGKPIRRVSQLESRTSAAQPHTTEQTMPTPKSRIFIGHGGAPVWKDLRHFLTDRLHLKCDEFNGEPSAGRSTKERLEEMLTTAAFAFLVLTGEDEQPDGSRRARENVIHEVGLFQGRLGFEKAIILLEEGCTRFSNIEGLTYIGFPKGQVMLASEEIRRVLEREEIIRV